MKKTFFAFAVALGLAACGSHNTDMDNNGNMIDSNVTPPPPQQDNQPTDTYDTSSGGSDSAIQRSDTGTLRSLNGANSANGAGGGNSSGQASGKSTGSENSGSATDETKGSK